MRHILQLYNHSPSGFSFFLSLFPFLHLNRPPFIIFCHPLGMGAISYALSPRNLLDIKSFLYFFCFLFVDLSLVIRLQTFPTFRPLS